MKVYEVRGPGHYLGTVSVVIAPNEDVALALAKAHLVQHGIKPKELEATKVLRELLVNEPRCYVLDDGEY